VILQRLVARSRVVRRIRIQHLLSAFGAVVVIHDWMIGVINEAGVVREIDLNRLIRRSLKVGYPSATTHHCVVLSRRVVN
jgi:hypothetical protein